MKKQSVILIGCMLALTLAAGMLGCTGPLLSWRGATVEAPDRIRIQPDGQPAGSWETRDLRIDYAYTLAEDTLSLSGSVELDPHLTTGFPVLEKLILSLNFLDSDGKVIETRRLKNFSHRRWILVDRMRFENMLTLPGNTVSMAFTYVGRVMDGGGTMDPDDGSGGSSWDFWEVPRR